MPDEIDLNEDEEIAMERAWRKLEQRWETDRGEKAQPPGREVGGDDDK